jgi:Zinc knuckle
MKKIASESVLTWIGCLHTCSLELSFTNFPVTELDIILVISEGLPSEYAPTVTDFDNLPLSELTPNLVRTRGMSKEAQLKHTALKEEEAFLEPDVAMAATSSSRGKGKQPTKGRKPLTCYNCGGKGHVASVCPSSQERAHVLEEEEQDGTALIAYSGVTFEDNDTISLF